MSIQYKIYCSNWIDGVKFDYPILDREKDLLVKNPKLIKEVNSLEQLTFTIYPDNINYSQLLLKESVIKVYRDKEIIFKGKITKEKINFDKSKQITCEGLLASLVDNYWNDINYAPVDVEYPEESGPFGDVLFDYSIWQGWFNKSIIQFYNDYCKNTDKIQIGEICPTIPRKAGETYPFYSGYGTGSMAAEARIEESTGKNLFEILKKAIDSAVYNGGVSPDENLNDYKIKYIVPSYDEDNTYINLYSDKDLAEKMNYQNIVFGENLINLFVDTDASNIITAIIPKGTFYDGQTEVEVTIPYWGPGAHQYEENPDIFLRGSFMFSKSGVDKYGWSVDKPENTRFVLNGKSIEQLGAEYLQRNGSRIKETITINAVDLAFATGYNVETFEFLKYVSISAPQHLNRELNYLITKVELNLLAPEQNKITFNQASNTTTGSSTSLSGSSGVSGNIANNNHIVNTNKSDYTKIENEINNIKNNYATAEYVSSVQTDLTSYVDQQEDEILSSVKEDTTIVKTVTYYRVVPSTEEGALEVIADGVKPTENQINIGELASCDRDVAVGDFVVLISASQDYEALKQTIQSLVSQTSDAIQLNFLTESVVNAIAEAAGEVDSKYSFVNNYFRFDVDGALTIGQIDNPFILKLQNDRISFIEDNVEIAYISNNKLYITDGEFLNSLDIGGFSFTPRSNGNLSFR